MRHGLFIAIILFILVFAPVVQAAQADSWTELYVSLLNDDTYLQQSQDYQLTDLNLSLPEQPLQSFSLQAQNELHDLAAMYSSSPDGRQTQDVAVAATVNNKMTETAGVEPDKGNFSGEDQPARLVFNPLPGVLVNADVQKDLKNKKLKTNANLQMSFQMNPQTMFRAEYGLVNKEWLGVNRITLDTDGTRSIDSADPFADVLLTSDKVSNSEESKMSRVGISYQTSDRVTITADYVDSPSNENQNFSTVFGVQYSDKIGSLKYQYEIDFGQNKQTTTGLQLGINDLATFNASYKLLNTDKLESQLRDSWNFGVDFNLNDRSTLSLGYQIGDLDKGDANKPDKNETGVENIDSKLEAQLEFKF